MNSYYLILFIFNEWNFFFISLIILNFLFKPSSDCFVKLFSVGVNYWLFFLALISYVYSGKFAGSLYTGGFLFCSLSLASSWKALWMLPPSTLCPQSIVKFMMVFWGLLPHGENKNIAESLTEPGSVPCWEPGSHLPHPTSSGRVRPCLRTVSLLPPSFAWTLSFCYPKRARLLSAVACKAMASSLLTALSDP